LRSINFWPYRATYSAAGAAWPDQGDWSESRGDAAADLMPVQVSNLHRTASPAGLNRGGVQEFPG